MAEESVMLGVLVSHSFEFTAYFVTSMFVPVEFGTGDGKLATQCLESSLAHCLVVVSKGTLNTKKPHMNELIILKPWTKKLRQCSTYH